MPYGYEWDQQRARGLIGCLIEETGLSATEIARRSGLAPSTLTRIYPTPSVGYSLSARSITKLKEAFPEAFAMCVNGGRILGQRGGVKAG
ncbi:helix-turn-helix domain-containing protein, partial [Sphingobium sp. DC-2]|uniref:helix-turn-helix domain-containing protein n=1 Tax=Sphingobium sp. DC-2 TaxID=1303256 RepID=UPI00307B8575